MKPKDLALTDAPLFAVICSLFFLCASSSIATWKWIFAAAAYPEQDHI